MQSRDPGAASQDIYISKNYRRASKYLAYPQYGITSSILISVRAIITVRVIQYYKRRLRRKFLAPNTSTSLKPTLAADAHLAEGQSLDEEQTLNNGKSLIYRAGTRRPTISKTEGQNFKPK
jgi:hypothetical protein